MNPFERSESIKVGLRQGFQNGGSKMAKRKCYGYTVGSDGQLVINSDKAQTVRWIFERYLTGDSFVKIASGLEQQGILSPTGRAKWNREAIDKLLSNEKYTGRVLLQKTISTGISQIENDGLIDCYLYTGTHEAIISDEMLMAVQKKKVSRAKEPEKAVAMSLALWLNAENHALDFTEKVCYTGNNVRSNSQSDRKGQLETASQSKGKRQGI